MNASTCCLIRSMPLNRLSACIFILRRVALNGFRGTNHCLYPFHLQRLQKQLVSPEPPVAQRTGDNVSVDEYFVFTYAARVGWWLLLT